MTEKEWRMFNDILLEIYYAGSLETFGESDRQSYSTYPDV